MIPISYSSVSLLLNIYIDETQEGYELPPHERMVRKIWDALPLETAQYLALLDQFLFDNRFHVSPGRHVVGMLMDCGIARVGDLIDLNLDDVAQRSGLDERQLHRLSAAIGKMGLSFESDVSRWREYRATVPPEFQLQPPYGRRLPQRTASAQEI